MACDILKNGKKPGDMEIQYASKTTKEYNKEICEMLNITAPDGYTELKSDK